MPTLRDVAKRAGVAPITVSRVINNAANVSSKTRELVKQAINELGYRPNRLARSLRLKKTHTLALVVSDITNPFWTTVVRGVEDAAQDAGFSVILCNTDESPDKQKQYLDVLLQKQVDGLLLVPTHTDGELLEWINCANTPVVILDRWVDSDCVDIVRSDSQEGAYQLVKHLIDLGHQRIAVLSGPEGISTSVDRVVGYQHAMREAKLDICPDWIIYSGFRKKAGYEMAQKILDVSPRPTALFAANNFIAIGALEAVRDVGLDVPGDISLVVFDDLFSEWAIEPFLTAAAQPVYQMGQHAARLLLDRLSHTGPLERQEIILPVEIIIRRSSAKPAADTNRVSQQLGVYAGTN